MRKLLFTRTDLPQSILIDFNPNEQKIGTMNFPHALNFELGLNDNFRKSLQNKHIRSLDNLLVFVKRFYINI